MAFRGRYELLSLGVEKNTSDDGDSRSAGHGRITFPWVRALPGLIIGAGALVWIVVQGPAGPEVPQATTAAFFQSWLDRLAPIVQSAESTGIGWVLLSLILTFACWELTLRAVGKRS